MQMIAQAPGARRGWLFNPAVDLGLIGLPLLIAFAGLAWLPDDFGKPLWAYVVFVVSFDVAHVWSTGHLTYFNREKFSIRRRFLSWIIPVTFATSFAVHLGSPVLFWTLVAYVAVFHFIRQQWGFIAIYRVLGGQRTHARFDKLALWTGALGPIALWHADPTEVFSWFDAGEEFAFRLPEVLGPWVMGWMATVAVVWTIGETLRVRRGGPVVWAKWAWMLGAWVSWWFGLRVAGSFLVATAFINLFHGVPYTALVWWRTRASGQRPWGWLWFYAPLLALALAEETLWEGLVWRAYFPSSWWAFEHAVWGSAFVAALSLPQVVHYMLDGVLWRGGDSRNQDFSERLRASSRSAEK